MASGDQGLYQRALARIHLEGFEAHWERAAPFVLETLQRHGVKSGRVIDLGCGGGGWARTLVEAGYEVCGVDISPTMIEHARSRVQAELICGSFLRAPLGRCDAVTSLGEPISYLESQEQIRALFKRVFAALRPGGLFIFDLRVLRPGQSLEYSHARVEERWAVFSKTQISPEHNRLDRKITCFVRGNSGDGGYERHEELHRLSVFGLGVIQGMLMLEGFVARWFEGYGSYTLGEGQAVFLARKLAPRA